MDVVKIIFGHLLPEGVARALSTYGLLVAGVLIELRLRLGEEFIGLSAPRWSRCQLAQRSLPSMMCFRHEPKTRPQLGSRHLELCVDVLEQQSGNPDFAEKTACPPNPRRIIPPSLKDTKAVVQTSDIVGGSRHEVSPCSKF